MKRFHVHLSVQDLNQNIRFYSAIFGAPPSVQKSDYAKWMLEDPRVNFAITQRGAAIGLNHLGFQVDSDAELLTLRAQAEAAGIAAQVEDATSCCYAKSDKHWTQDPQGIAWETFHTLGSIPVFGGRSQPEPDTPVVRAAGSCGPRAEVPGAAARSACC